MNNLNETDEMNRDENMSELTGFQRDLLYIVAGLDEPSGLDIKQELDEYYDEPINHGRLYPNLDTVVDRGMIEKGQLDRRTNYYSVTDEGREQIQERREWESTFIESMEEQEEQEDIFQHV